MSVRKTIQFDDELFEDAAFCANYQHRKFPEYVRMCVEAENQKRLKDYRKRQDEKIHVKDVVKVFQRRGNESEGKL